ASLQAVVKRTLAPYAGSERLEIGGPDLLLAPKAALAMSAAVQELSTNAAKYGAFSSPSGRLAVSWIAEDDGRVRLTWIESGGPLVGKPSRQGFGTKMIASVFQGETGWSVNLDFDPVGLRCTMRFYPRQD